MRVYLSHYGEVYSLKKADAIQVAKDALDPNKDGYNLNNYPSTKMLKRPEVDRDVAGFYQNKKWIEVHFCLDWDESDWRYFLEELTN